MRDSERPKTVLDPARDYLRELWTTLSRGWDRFWFAPADATTLGCIRIITGLVILYIHLTTLPQLMELIGPEAWIDQQGMEELLALKENVTDERGQPLDVGRTWNGAVSFWFLVQDPALIWFFQSVFLVAAFCFTVGFFSRTAGVIVWAGHLSYIQRGVTIMYGMDTILLLLMMYLIFAPVGRTLSIDRLIARYRESRRSLREHSRLPSELTPKLTVAGNWSIRMIQIHMCIVYLCAGLAKLQGSTWWSGYAIYLTLLTPEFAFLDLRWIAKWDWLWQTVSHAGVVFTLVTEIGFAFLIWHRLLRPVMLFFAFMLQIGIGLFMGLGSFQVAMFAGCLAFVSPAFLGWVLEKLFKGPAGYRFIYDRRLDRGASWIRAADPWTQIDLIEAHEKDAPAPAGSLLTPDGRVLQGYDAFRQVVRSLRVLWPIALLTFVPGFGALARQFAGRQERELQTATVR